MRVEDDHSRCRRHCRSELNNPCVLVVLQKIQAEMEAGGSWRRRCGSITPDGQLFRKFESVVAVAFAVSL